MSDCVLFPASLSKNRAWSVWADRESYLSLAEGTCTLIRPRVQPCGWKRYVRAFTVIYVSTNRTRSSYAVTFSGMTLDELAALLRSHNVKVEVYHASDTTLNQFRSQAKANLTRSGDYIIVNYQRSVLGQGKSGHISPLAAYHEPSDRFLIEDVASYKYPPVWASTENLWKAMNTTDSTSKKTRGYLVVRQ
ncbi:phytochelatin synthase family protein [Microcoleus sp. BROC3]|uniref:phytochelatin synthase family protein n=1 Tax=Microcoleus sp. BROC3 TaxID=3055323 RepID=UPI002FD2D035